MTLQPLPSEFLIDEDFFPLFISEEGRGKKEGEEGKRREGKEGWLKPRNCV
jgi:hypothetical protein